MSLDGKLLDGRSSGLGDGLPESISTSSLPNSSSWERCIKVPPLSAGSLGDGGSGVLLSVGNDGGVWAEGDHG